MSEILEVSHRPPEFPMLVLLREAFSEAFGARTVEKRRELLLSMKEHLKVFEREVNAGIREVDRKIRQKKRDKRTR